MRCSLGYLVWAPRATDEREIPGTSTKEELLAGIITTGLTVPLPGQITCLFVCLFVGDFVCLFLFVGCVGNDMYDFFVWIDKKKSNSIYMCFRLLRFHFNFIVFF